MIGDSRRSSGWATSFASARSGAGFFIDGGLHDFNGLADLLRFTPLTPLSALRLGWFVAQCQLRARLRRARRAAARDLAAPPLRPRGSTSASGSRCSTPASRAPERAARHVPLGAHPAHVGRTREGQRRRRAVRAHRRRPPAADRRGDRARRASWASSSRTGAPVEGLALEDGAVDRRAGRRRDRALRPHDPHASAARARKLLPEALTACSRRIPSAGSAWSACFSRCRSRCCPTTRSTSPSRRRSPPSSRPRTCSAPTTRTASGSCTCRATARRTRPSRPRTTSRSTSASPRSSRGCRPTSRTTTSSTGRSSAPSSSSPCTRSVAAPRWRPSGPACRAWPLPRTPRSTPSCSTATPWSASRSASPARRLRDWRFHG